MMAFTMETVVCPTAELKENPVGSTLPLTAVQAIPEVREAALQNPVIPLRVNHHPMTAETVARIPALHTVRLRMAAPHPVSGSSTVLSRTTGAAFAPFSVFAVGSSFVIFVCSFHCRRAGYHRCSKRMERFGVFCKNIRRRTAPYPPPENTDRGRGYHSSTSISPVSAWYR